MPKKRRNPSDEPPHLPREEQVALARRAAHGDRRAADTLIRASKGFLMQRVRKYGAARIRQDPTFEEDLYNEAALGMFEALRRYDDTRGVHPLTYAAHWIDLHLRKALLVNVGPASVGPVKAWRNAGYPKSVAVSLDAPAGEAQSSAGRRPATVGDRLPAPGDPADDVLSDHRELHRWRRRMGKAVASLAPRERTVIERRILGDPPPTLKELGAELGISRERTRQVELVAVAKLCDALGIRRTTPAALIALAAGKSVS